MARAYPRTGYSWPWLIINSVIAPEARPLARSVPDVQGERETRCLLERAGDPSPAQRGRGADPLRPDLPARPVRRRHTMIGWAIAAEQRKALLSGPLRRALPGGQVAEAAAAVEVVPELGRDDAGQADVVDEPRAGVIRGSASARRAGGRRPRGRSSRSRGATRG